MELNKDIKKISTDDIILFMTRRLMGTNYLNEDILEQKQIICECLREYLVTKVAEIRSDIDLFDKDCLELVSILNSSVDQSEKCDSLSHIIHYLLSAISIVQEFLVTWEIDSNKNEADDPILQFNHHILDKLQTGEIFNIYKTFGILYEFYTRDINKAITEDIKLSLTMED